VARIFLSYRREDSGGHAGRLFDRLAAAFGPSQVFMDVGLAPGADFEEAIQRTIESCDAVVVIIGPRWLEARGASGRRLDVVDDLVRREIEAALQQRERPTIPVLMQGAQMPTREELAESLWPLTRRNALEISDSRFDYDATRLVDALKQAIGAGKGTRARPRMPRWVFAAAIPLLLAAAALLAYGLTRPQSVVVPDVVGKPSASKAEETLTKAGLKLDPNPKRQVDEKVPPGTVISQTPEKGAEVEKGTPVSVLIAVDSSKVNVPDVTRKTAQEADKLLRAKHLTLGQSSPTNTDPKARIVSQIPAAGEVVAPGSPVNIFYADPGT
jgi:TIR domain/PASTA domain